MNPPVPASRARVSRVLWPRALAGFIGLALWTGAPAAVVTYSLSAVSPSGASSGVTILVTGDTFDASAANNEVLFIPQSAPSRTSTPLAVTTLDSVRNLRRLAVRVPDGLPVGPAALRVVNRSSGEVSEGLSIDIVDLHLPTVASAPAGASGVNVRISGSPNSRFAPSSRVVFGAGITVTSVTIESPTSLTARITVSAAAAPGPRNPSVASPTQSAILTGGFVVTSPGPPPNDSPTAVVTAPSSGIAGQVIAFDGSGSSDPNAGDTLEYEWQFGDGGAATTAAADHTYLGPGTYSGSLTVRDGRGGSDTQTFQITVTAAPLGRGVITGRVFDDMSGLPIADASAQLLGADGQPLATLPSISDAHGRYRLAAVAGPARIRVTKPGYTFSDILATVVDSRRVEPDDARLTMLNGQTVPVSSVTGGTVRHGAWRLDLPPAAFSQDRIVRLTEITPQGPARRLPLGWSPLAIADLSAGSLPFDADAALSVRPTLMAAAGREVVVVRWDAAAGQWVASGAATRSDDGLELNATVSGPGQHVFAVADLSPNAPPAWSTGAPILGVAPRPPPTVQLSLNPAPRILFAQAGARSAVDAHIIPTEPLPSGTPLVIDLAESFRFVGGSSLYPQPGRRRLSLLNVPDAQLNGMRASFGVSPSRPLTPFTLREGAIDLAGRMLADPGGPRGQVFSGSGGVFTAPGGERVIVPAGAAAEDIPVDFIDIPAADFPLPLPSGFTLVRAFTIDLHGTPLNGDLQVSVPFTGSIPAGSLAMLVYVADLADETRLALSAVATVVNGSLLTTSDPFGNGTVRLPGIREEGRYALLVASGDLRYLIGSVRDAAGGTLGGALVEADTSTIAAITDAAGRYVLLAASGSTVVRATNLANRDTVQVTTQVSGAVAVTSQEISLGASPPAIVSVTPTNGATGVALGAAITVRFSEPIDATSVNTDSVRLLLGTSTIPASVSLEPGNTAVTLRASGLLQSHTQYSVSVAGSIRDAAGHQLGIPHVSTFTTLDVTPPAPPPPGTITASIPGGDAQSTVVGSAGTADPGGVVIIRNLRTNALTTLTPDVDGSFSGIVAALRSDRLEMTIRDAAGNETTVPVPGFRGADGSVVVGAEGGRVEGPGGVAADIPSGALPNGTVVRVTPIVLTELPIAAPAEYGFVGGVRLELGGVIPAHEIDLSITAPGTATEGDAVVVVKPVQFGQTTRWSVVDRAALVEGRYATTSPPFPGIIGEGNYSFLRSTGDCLSYVAVNVQYGFNAFAVAVGVPFVFPVINVTSVVIPAPCGSTLNIQVTQPDTGALIEQITAFAPQTPNLIVTSTETLTDDSTPPVVLQVNNPTGQQTRRVELTFSEPMDAASVCQAVRVTGHDGAVVPGHVFGCPATATSSPVLTAVFLPDVPFQLGEQYTITLTGAFDLARNPIAAEPFVFTPFEPRSLSLLQDEVTFRDALSKCVGGACSTSAMDQVVIGNTLFIANGTRTIEEQYATTPPRRLLAVDVTDPAAPRLIGWHETATNPRALAAVDNANVAGFQGDLLLVAGGGRVAGGELAGKLEVYDVSLCTQRPAQLPNCLDPAFDVFKGAKFLSTPAGGIPRPGVPFEAGVPQQMAVLHERRAAPAQDTLVAYITVPPIGIEAVDINGALNAPFDANTNYAPDAIQRGDFTDVAVARTRVLGVGPTVTTGGAGLRVFSAQLQDVAQIPPPLPDGLSSFAGAARVGTASNVVFDIDGDGNLGLAEDEDGDPTTALQEIFDLAVIASGPLTDGCLGAVPCGELYVLDISSLTALRPGSPAVLARIPLPAPAFAVQVDGLNGVIYVELRGRGLGIVDLTHLQRRLQGIPVPPGAWDANFDGTDDRLLRIITRTDTMTADLEIDTARGIAFVNGSAAGPQIVQVSVNCSDLALDFKPKPAGTLPTWDQEKGILVAILNGAADRLLTEGGFADVGMLEQGSGSCFWRADFPRGCTSFIPGTSDHDIEVFVPQVFVAEAQDILDSYIESKPSGIERLGALTLFAVAREPFENAELLNGTPRNRSGDPAGDLAMGRQLLTLLWLLEGEYVTGRRGTMPTLDQVLDRLRSKHESADPVFPGEPSGIPRLEGYEWSLLQEFNFFKSGAMIRIRNACGGGIDVSADIARGDDVVDRSGNFEEDELRAGCQEEIHLVGKAAIRSALARLAAHDASNPTILNIDRARYRSNACLTGVADPRRPPADPAGYTEKACGSFEEYIVNVVVRSVRDGHGVFTAADLPRIFTFYCAKVGENCANREGQRIVGPLFDTDALANRFVADALRFIEVVQGQTFDAFITTLDNDTDPIGQIPFLAEITNLCTQHAVTISATHPRADLRRCNRAIVRRKTNGDAESEDPAKRGGVRNYVTKNLRVRALNLASRTLDVPVAMYEGTGTNRADYTEIRRVVLSRFGGGEIRFLEDEPDPDRPGQRRPMFKAVFDLAQLSANVPRAISFFIDPDGTVPESDRHDNAAAFFYYLLNPDQPDGPTPAGEPEFPTDAIEHDPLCRDGPTLQFEIRAYGPGNTDQQGARELSLKVGQTVDVLYRVRNTGTGPIRNLQVTRDGQVVGTIPEVAPGSLGEVVWETYTVRPGTAILRAVAWGFDADGNTLPPAVDAIRLQGTVPPCAADFQSLDADPNPFSEIGLPVSTVMRGGKLIRYYRLVRHDGGSVDDQVVTIRIARSNGTETVTVARTDPDGLLRHVNQGDDDDPRGVMLDASQIGAPGESATITLEGVDGASTTCRQAFTAVVTERNYARTLKAGSSLEISGALLGLNLRTKPGVGFEYSISGDTGAGDLTAALSRLMSTTASVGLKATAAKARVQFGGTGSLVEAEIAGALRASLMLRDKHIFQLVQGGLTNDQQVAIAHLIAGLMFNSTLAGSASVTGPTGPLLALVLNELQEQITGTAQYRTSAGGSLGFGGRVSGELGGPTLSFRQTGIPVLRNLGLTIGAEGSADVSAFLHLDLGSDLSVGGEYRQAFDLSAQLELELLQVGQDLQTKTVIARGVRAIQNMLDASGEAAGSIKITFIGGISPPELRRIVVSISHKKKYGFSLVGVDLVDEGSDDMRTLKFTISDSRKFERVLQNIATLQAMELALNGIPAQVALSPVALADQIVTLLGEFDGFEETIERGNSYTIPIGLEGFLGGTGLGGTIELKLDSMMTTTLRKGAVTARDMYTLERYEAHDDAFPSPLGEELIEGINAAISAVQSLLSARERLVRAAALIETVRTIGFRFSPSGIDLQVNGAAEPEPLAVDILGFKYQPVAQSATTFIREPVDVAGPADGPHYGVGGFFNISPTDRPLAAPAQLTIHWDAPEIQGFDPAALGIYRWNETRTDWDFIGGAVDLAGEFVRVDIDRFGLYTAAPPMASGNVGVEATYAATGTEAEPTTTITFTSAPVTMNTGAAAPDGTIFTVRALVPDASDPISSGEILTADADPTREGVQVATQNGRVEYTVRVPGRVGSVLAVIHALYGTALGERVVIYERPQ